MKKIILPAIIIFISVIFALPAFGANAAISEYLCELGVQFYKDGRYEDALHEFKKVLMVDPDNPVARKFVNELFQKESAQSESQKEASKAPQKTYQPPVTKKSAPITKDVPTEQKPISRDQAMEDALSQLDKEKSPGDKRLNIGGLNITGETQVSMGITSKDFYWKRANGDLNEENYRILSGDGLNRYTNTYDPRIYDRLGVNLDTDNKEGFNFHGNITVDPWSFIGKSENVNVKGVGGDVVQLQLKYWSNNSYTIGENFYTLENGDAFSVPEMKVVDLRTRPISITSINSNIFNLPEIKIDRDFYPVREIWVDYTQEDLKFRFFPIAYENQAYTSDDPMTLSNRHIWWQESPWIRKWLPGTVNSALSPEDFTPGYIDNSLAYFTRDSDGRRLTALRGLSFEYSPIEDLSISTNFATPKELWQDYSSLDNAINATRIKYRLLDNLSIGSLYTYRIGFDSRYQKDFENQVVGVDLGVEPFSGIKVAMEAANSLTRKDLTNEDYRSKSRGNTYYFSLLGAFPRRDIMDVEHSYFGLKPEKEDTFFTKFRLFAARMDEGFDSSLASFHETRDDAFWSRHIQFKRPFEYYYSGLYFPGVSWDNIEPYRIGDGIDAGRDVIGFRMENTLWDKKLEHLFDVRNVHNTNGKFIENVARDEITYNITDKLTSKFLFIYHRLPKTKGGYDPFVIDSETGEYVLNAAIEDGMNPTLKTGSMGFEYAFTDWLSLSGVWERTNDYTLAYDNFPRGDLSSSTFVAFSEYGRNYRELQSFLYSQDLFPLPPYPFYNIWKSGLRINPIDKLTLYIDYTRNEFKSAGQIDDNINHIGFEASYMPNKKFGLFLKYTYSRWNDINRMLKGFDKIYLGNHNFFAEFRYLPTSDDEFVLQYGEAGRSNVYTQYTDPFSSGIPTLDTQHIFRMYYRKRF